MVFSNFTGDRADITSRDLIVSCREEGEGNLINKQIHEILKENNCLEY